MTNSCSVESPITIQIPEYDTAYAEFRDQILRILVTTIDPLLGEMPTSPRRHRGPLRNVPGVDPLDHPMVEYRHVTEFTSRSIEETNLEDFQAVMLGVAEEQSTFRGEQLFNVITGVTGRTGMQRSLDGKSLTASDLVEIFESIDPSFDDEGNMQPVTLVVNPAQRELVQRVMASREFRFEFAKMKERKERTWRDTKRHRTLSH